MSQVVHDYGDVCQTLTELAGETNAPFSTDDFRMLNRCLDDAIAGAVTTYARESQQSHLADAAQLGDERIGFLVHELRNLVNTAMISFEVVKTGNVGVSGSTGAVLQRSLTGLRDLIARSLDDVRVTNTTRNRKLIPVSAFIEEVRATATLAADARGIKLVVLPVQDGVAIEVDQQAMAAVIGDLLQNAFKFTRPHTTVTLSVGASADRVLRASERIRLALWASRPTVAGSTRAICLARDASLPWTCRGPRFEPLTGSSGSFRQQADRQYPHP